MSRHNIDIDSARANRADEATDNLFKASGVRVNIHHHDQITNDDDSDGPSYLVKFDCHMFFFTKFEEVMQSIAFAEAISQSSRKSDDEAKASKRSDGDCDENQDRQEKCREETRKFREALAKTGCYHTAEHSEYGSCANYDELLESRLLKNKGDDDGPTEVKESSAALHSAVLGGQSEIHVHVHNEVDVQKIVESVRTHMAGWTVNSFASKSRLEAPGGVV